MTLNDDVAFYARAVDTGELTRDQAARLLAEASGWLTVTGAARSIDNWAQPPEETDRIVADAVTMVRAVRNGRPVPRPVLDRLTGRTRRPLED
ncbi:hypothetical protein [Streptomyces sp. NPDC018055]|uniref:hypothetical protein n=1 Tax=Streptomyces sp. NPDC018055 TaxID=3365038 RepID=UPI003791541A